MLSGQAGQHPAISTMASTPLSASSCWRLSPSVEIASFSWELGDCLHMLAHLSSGAA